MKENINLIESRLKELMKKNSSYHNMLFEAANYSLLSGGKRLRPLLVLAILEAFDSDNCEMRIKIEEIIR